MGRRHSAPTELGINTAEGQRTVRSAKAETICEHRVNFDIVETVRGTQPSAAPEAGAAFFPDQFATYAPGVDTIFSSQSYDCAVVIALAAAAAGSNDAADIADAMVDVTRGGTKCQLVADCLALIADGEDIDYDGASGPLDFLDEGEPSVGAYDIYEYDADGNQQVLEQLVFDAS